MGRSLDGEQKESLAEETKAILEEARMVLPGDQTLFGFQLVAVFNARFVELSAELETVHLVALTAILVSMSFVMTPAAYHRIAGRGRISKRFVDLASWLDGAAGIERSVRNIHRSRASYRKFAGGRNDRRFPGAYVPGDVVCMANVRRFVPTTLNLLAPLSA